MSSKGLIFEKKVVDYLSESGFKVSRAQDNDKGVDWLAVKDQCVFAIQIKDRPLESFDIISGSTITAGTVSTSITGNPVLQNKEVMPVLVSGSIVLEDSKTFGDEMGVIVTDYGKIVESLNIACSKLKKE